MSHGNDVSNKKSSSSILFDSTTENSKIDKSLNDNEKKGAVFNLLGFTGRATALLDLSMYSCGSVISFRALTV